MKACKKIFKPVIIIVSLACVSLVMLVKSIILGFGIKSQYKHLAAINAAINKLHRHIYNPYRIPNGIRPVIKKKQDNSLADIQKCHEIISQMRLARAN